MCLFLSGNFEVHDIQANYDEDFVPEPNIGKFVILDS